MTLASALTGPRPCAGRGLLAAALVLACVAAPGVAAAQKTPIMEVDLQDGSTRRIDGGGKGSSADAALDALLDEATDPTFSSRDLDRVAGALRRYLGADRPRAMPRVLLFLYPGRISKSKLQELREVRVDLELVLDPCGRSVCELSTAKSMVLLGRSMGQPELQSSRYTVKFQDVTVRRRSDLKDAMFETLRFPAARVVEAGKDPSLGTKLVQQAGQARAGYADEVGKAISRGLRARRVSLKAAPQVSRTPAEVTVALTVQSDRVRTQRHVMDALKAVSAALVGAGALTPASGEVTVTALVPVRGKNRRVFRCQKHALDQLARGRITASELWDTYVVEEKQEGRRLSFADDEATGGGGDEAAASGEGRDPDDVAAVVTESASLLTPCVADEAQRDRSFAGVTLVFSVTPGGRATGLTLEGGGAGRGALRRCLSRALERIRFPRGGAEQKVRYPLVIKR